MALSYVFHVFFLVSHDRREQALSVYGSLPATSALAPDDRTLWSFSPAHALALCSVVPCFASVGAEPGS